MHVITSSGLASDFNIMLCHVFQELSNKEMFPDALEASERINFIRVV